MSLEAVLRRDRQVSLGLLALVLVLAWGWLLSGAGMGMSAWEMTRPATMIEMPGMATPISAPVWTPGYALLMVGMWWSMMVAMMLPSAAPVVLLVAALERRATPGRAPFGSAAGFAAGYLLAWGAFSLLAVTLQWWLSRLGHLDAMLRSASPWLTGGLLVATGFWQLSPLKHACLRHCRTPIAFLTQARARGRPGAVRLGVAHGSYCLGCCWALMALLFVGGIMSLYWIVGLTLYVLVEKLLPGGPLFSRLVGGGLMIAGVLTLGFAA